MKKDESSSSSSSSSGSSGDGGGGGDGDDDGGGGGILPAWLSLTCATAQLNLTTPNLGSELSLNE